MAGWVLLTPNPALAAACNPLTPWSPGLSVSPHGTYSSRAFTLSWTANAPGVCTGWAGTNHLRIVRKAGMVAPSSPTDGTTVANPTTSASQYTVQWDWLTRDDDSDGCADIAIDDVHDNTYIPLPGDNYKIYYKDYTDFQIYSRYGDGDDWFEEVPIHIYWDTGTPYTSSPDGECVENVSALVRLSGGVAEEAMFFLVQDSDWCGASGLDSLDDLSDNDDGAIVYARHVN